MSKSEDRPPHGDKKPKAAPESTPTAPGSAAGTDGKGPLHGEEAERERSEAQQGGRPAGRGEQDDQLGVRGGGNNRHREEIREITHPGRRGSHRPAGQK